MQPASCNVLRRCARESTRTRGRYEYSDAALMSFSSLLSADVRASNREVRFCGHAGGLTVQASRLTVQAYMYMYMDMLCMDCI